MTAMLPYTPTLPCLFIGLVGYDKLTGMQIV